MRPLAPAAVLAAMLIGCAGRHRGDAAAPASLPPASGAILLTAIEMPEAGSVFGGHFGGQAYDVQQLTYQLTDATRSRWGRAAQARAEALLRGAGFPVHAMGPSSSDAQPLRGVQYGLSGRVTTLAVRSTGPAEPFRVEAQVEVAWELLDLGSGRAVFGRTLRHVARETGTVDSIVGRALDGALIRLMADSSFRYALAAPRADPDAGGAVRFGRVLPEGRDPIRLGPADLNPSPDSSVLGRITAGLATLRNSESVFGTAFLITRDGLALTSARSVRNLRRLRARLASGIERPIRVVRTSRVLGVALIQIACAECETVDWDAPEGVDVYTTIITVGAPESDVDGVQVTFGRVGGRWGMAHGLTLEVQGNNVGGGDPVARTTSGRVFALVASRPGRRSVLLLSEVLAELNVTVSKS